MQAEYLSPIPASQTSSAVGTVSRLERTDKWQQHLDRWESSGKSLRNYCISHGLSEQRAYYWQKKLKPALSLSQQKVVKVRKCIRAVVKAVNESCNQEVASSAYCTIELGDGKQVRIVSAVAYSQLLERILTDAAIV